MKPANKLSNPLPRNHPAVPPHPSCCSRTRVRSTPTTTSYFGVRDLGSVTLYCSTANSALLAPNPLVVVAPATVARAVHWVQVEPLARAHWAVNKVRPRQGPVVQPATLVCDLVGEGVDAIVAVQTQLASL